MSSRTLRARTAAAYQTSRGSVVRALAIASRTSRTDVPIGPGSGSGPVSWAYAVVVAASNGIRRIESGGTRSLSHSALAGSTYLASTSIAPTRMEICPSAQSCLPAGLPVWSTWAASRQSFRCRAAAAVSLPWPLRGAVAQNAATRAPTIRKLIRITVSVAGRRFRNGTQHRAPFVPQTAVSTRITRHGKPWKAALTMDGEGLTPSNIIQIPPRLIISIVRRPFQRPRSVNRRSDPVHVGRLNVTEKCLEVSEAELRSRLTQTLLPLRENNLLPEPGCHASVGALLPVLRHVYIEPRRPLPRPFNIPAIIALP
jgi:hypothetical protein